MDLKKESARIAFSLIKNNSSVGLGDGSAFRSLAAYLAEGINSGLDLKLYTSSFTTERFLTEAGLTVSDLSHTDSLHQYFDGCDQVDFQLNALKSGSGIHTQEKLLASMADEFIILADESKFIGSFDPKFPLVLEVLPQACGYVMKAMKKMFPLSMQTLRTSAENANGPVLTRNGNHLLDCRFPEWPDPFLVQSQCRPVTGVVDISLFYQLASEAIIAGENGVNRYQKNQEGVHLINRYPLELQ